MKIDYIRVCELRPYPNNARTHSKKQVRLIANSIGKFGFCNPVLIDDDKQIIAGHGRVEAAKLLGIDAVPTCRLSHLSEADRRAYILADNKLAEKAGWDKQLLSIELQYLIDLDVDIELTGFEMPEIDIILEDAREAAGASSGSEDAVPQHSSAPAVSRTGDLWLLGNHRLLCADARDEASARGRQGGIRVHGSALQRRHRRSCLWARSHSSSRVRHGLRRDERDRVYDLPANGL
jgi:ParB/Sulfiredoxin domain